MKNPFGLDFLISKIGPCVELCPVTGEPRLIKGLNEVWDVIDEFGGVNHTTKHFGIEERFVHCWICDHYIPAVFAFEIAKKLNYSNFADFQEPSTGYEDTLSGECWPFTWKAGWVDELYKSQFLVR